MLATLVGADRVALHDEGARGPAVCFFDEAELAMRAATHDGKSARAPNRPVPGPMNDEAHQEVQMTLPFTGRCACGGIHYRASARPTFSWLCHCRDCQRASGSAYCSIMYVSRDALAVHGNARYHTVSAESGNRVSRGFCADCGSPMFILADLVPDLQGVWAASLDEPAGFEPVVQVWCGSAQSWDTLHPTLPRIAKAPSPAEFERILADAARG